MFRRHIRFEDSVMETDPIEIVHRYHRNVRQPAPLDKGPFKGPQRGREAPTINVSIDHSPMRIAPRKLREGHIFEAQFRVSKDHRLRRT